MNTGSNLRLATGDNYEEASRLVDSYNQLAKELGATTTQMTAAADSWLRQGYSIADTNELIRDSMVLSKVGAMDSATATENLTSAMKGYGLAVEDVAGIVDKLTAIDLQAAVSASDLATAMSRTANSANISGVEMNKLLGYIAAVEEVTQKSAESIGNSFQTIFARMGNVKLGKFLSDDGEDLSDVEKILSHFGIALRDSNDQFRNFGEVLDDVAAKWQNLSNVDQNALATTIAGTRQRENFLVLMQNYGKAMDYAAVAADSAGTAEQKFSAYLDSVEAHYNTLIASAEALAKQTVPAELMNGLMDAASTILDFLEATNLLTIALSTLGAALAVKGFSAFVGKIKSIYQNVTNLSAACNILGRSANVKLSTEQFDQLLTVTKGLNAQQLKLVVSNKALTTEQRIAILTANGMTDAAAAQTLATMGLATAEGTATAATFSLSGAFTALKAAIASNPIGFLLVALTTVVSVISTVNSKIQESHRAIIEAGNEAAESGSKIVELTNSYLELSEAVDAGTASREDMLAAQADVIDALGLEGKGIDELIAKYGDLKSAIISTSMEALETNISTALAGVNTAVKDAVSELETFSGTNISSISNKDVFQYLSDSGYSGITIGGTGGTISVPNVDYWDAFSDPSFEELLENRQYLKEVMNAVRQKFGSDNDVFNQLSEAYQRYNDALEPVVEAIDNANRLIAQSYIQAAKALDDPKTQEEFDAFKQSIVNNLQNDLDWNSDGSYTPEGIVDSILAADRIYGRFYAEIDGTLDKVEDSVAAHGGNIRETLESLWNSEDFDDTKKSILEMANTLDGITADNIDDLISSSSELAAILDQDGMSAQFLAHVLQTVAMGGDGFALITEEALTLNSALEGLKGQFSDVADAKSRYDAAMKAPEKDTDFKSYAAAFKELNEQFVAGTTNSNAFWAAAEFLFGADQLQLWGWSDGLDQIYEAMQKNVVIFEDADSAGAGFLDRLYDISEAGDVKADDGSIIAQIEKLSDGSYDFNIDSSNLDAMTEKLGITSEAALACMEALSMYGDVNLYDIEAVFGAIEEIGLSANSIEGTAVNVGTLTDQLRTCIHKRLSRV